VCFRKPAVIYLQLFNHRCLILGRTNLAQIKGLAYLVYFLVNVPPVLKLVCTFHIAYIVIFTNRLFAKTKRSTTKYVMMRGAGFGGLLQFVKGEAIGEVRNFN